ncbi:CU044_5270 family protein [Actinomadura rudentiformis]|uniref:CU044_5270 family protein n=1 Tax=Actinomadura rudentiformis TaxID=359158 RepID=A0A6H9YLV0_9ACTN|nr:CU044_5270 family protein [Actinomadura rudentiformis]KAB2344126.1 hypothetical protein F8566_32970 [Actinomadura rudentiformis]
MDEITMVRELYGRPSPDPAMKERVQARLAAEQRSRRLPRNRRRTGLGAGFVALAAAASVVGAVLMDGDAARTQPGTTNPDTPGMVLLAAADKIEKAPVGRYWFNDTFSGQSYVIKARTGTYAIVGAHTESFSWAGAKPGDGVSFYSRDLPARPLTRADEAAWRKAGSPRSFPLAYEDKKVTYTMKAGRWSQDGSYPEQGGEFLLLRSTGKPVKMTFEQLQKLPSDPDALAKLLFAPEENPRFGPVTAIQKISRAKAALSAPITPQVRAAVMRALAKQPGVRAINDVTDPLGRRGVALTADYDFVGPDKPQYGSRQEVIFDRNTGALLGSQTVLTKPGGPYSTQRPGFVIFHSLVRDSGWSDTRPTPPSKLPF